MLSRAEAERAVMDEAHARKEKIKAECLAEHRDIKALDRDMRRWAERELRARAAVRRPA